MRLLLLFFLVFLIALPGRGQERVRNVRVRVADSSLLEIRYDLLNTRPGDSIYFEVRSRLRGALRILPEFVRGDVGQGIPAGADRRIVWNALANGYSLSEEIRATVFVKTGLPPTPLPTEPRIADQPASVNPKPDVVPQKPTPPASVTVAEPQPDKPAGQPTPAQPVPSQPAPVTPAPADPAVPVPTRYTGPAWALVSAVAPGIGNIFVQTPRPKIGLRPLALIGSYGLFIYGLAERKQARDAYVQYELQKNTATAEPYYKTANDHHHRYFLATRGAVVIAAADVILTVMKGLRNRQATRVQSVTVRPGLQAGQPTAVVRYSF